MITTVNLNPCVDRAIMVPSVSLGKFNLAEKTRVDIAGKGINVAVALSQLDVPVVCAGIGFDGDRAKLYEGLDGFGIPYDFVIAPGEMRTNIKILDMAKNEMTEINSRGEPVNKNVLDQFLEKLKVLGKTSDIVVLGGRLPNGSDVDYYKRCIEVLSEYPVKVFVDADGEPLKQAIVAKPFLIKPNAYELGKLFDEEVNTVEDAIRLSKRVIDRGVSVVCSSLGDQGAVIVDSKSVWYSPAMNVEPKGVQGAGDSMIAGICKAITEGLPIKEMLRYGTAAAAASLIREGTLLCQKTDFERLLPSVEISAYQ